LNIDDALLPEILVVTPVLGLNVTVFVEVGKDELIISIVTGYVSEGYVASVRRNLTGPLTLLLHKYLKYLSDNHIPDVRIS
jgi:hypothetical protein